MVDQYVNGQMDRREFIRRMVGLGVSIVAAGTFAQALAPSEAKARTNEYGSPTTKQQCKNGGYRAFGFKNQGQCVAFVERGPKRKERRRRRRR